MLFRFFQLGLYALVLALPVLTHADEPINIGSRRELFVDLALADHVAGAVAIKLHQPVRREIALKFDQPWEGNASGYTTVFQDGDRFRMYYRGHRYIVDGSPLAHAQAEVVCYAESTDGLVWTKPKLGLFPWNGSTENNIIWMGSAETHNFAPFKDGNPNCAPEERYKAIGGTTDSKGLWTFKSSDGIHWTRKSTGPVVSKGAFDSHNTCFWDGDQNRYIMYVRYFSEDEFKGLRSIGVSYSNDFETWTEPVGLTYPGSPPQQMYTNQVLPYFRAPHILVGFPTRYVARPLNTHVASLDPVELRQRLIKADERCGTDLTDGVFMSSRDGQSFKRWDEAFLRPGPQAEGRWIYGDNYQAYGLWETASEVAGAPKEISMFFNEHAWVDETHAERRYTIRLDGFTSLNAPLSGGEFVSKPLIFSGRQFSVNYATSAAGSLRLEIQDTDGAAFPGFSLDDCLEYYGDSVEQVIAWKGGNDVSALVGKSVRLRFVLADGDLYSFQFEA